MAPRRIVEQDHALAADRRTAEHETDLEADAVARSRRFSDQHIAGVQPLEIAPEHVALSQQRFRRVDIVGQQVRRQHLVPEVLKARANRAAGDDAAAIAANRAGEINFHRGSSWRTRSIGIASAVPAADRTVVAWNSAL